MRKSAALVLQGLVVALIVPEPPTTNEPPTDSYARPGGHAGVAAPMSPSSRDWMLEVAAREYRQGDLQRAESTLRDWMADGETSREAGLGCVLLGRIHADREEHQEVIDALAACKAPLTVADLHSMMSGEAYLALKQPDQAIPHFEAVQTMWDSPRAPEAGFRLADAYFEAKRWRKAWKQYEGMLERYPEYSRWAQARFRLARSLEHMGRNRQAVVRYAALEREAPKGSKARKHSARRLLRLKNKNVRPPKDTTRKLAKRARKLHKQRRWPEAIATYEVLLERTTSRLKRQEIHYQLAKALESEDRYEEALEHLAESGGGGDALSAKIRIYRKQGRVDEAVEKTVGRAGRSARVRGLAEARVRYEEGDYVQAYALYSKHLKTKYGLDNQWLMAWVAYRAGEYDEAIRRFRDLTGKRKLRKHKAAYWLARALMKAGQRDAARAAFLEIADDDPVGYYGIQAANRLLDLGDRAGYVEVTGTEPDDVPLRETREAVGGSVRWTDGECRDVPLDLPIKEVEETLAALATDYGATLDSVDRAWDRYRMGLKEEARIELRIARAMILKANRVSSKRLAGLTPPLWFSSKRSKRGLWGSRLTRKSAITRWEKARRAKKLSRIRKLGKRAVTDVESALVTIGDPYFRRKAAYRKGWRTLRGVPHDGNRHLFAAAYPLAYQSTLVAESEQYGMSPFLMAAIARAESGFNDLAVSHVGARGLVQVMPVTGNLIAARRGDSEFAPALLLDPRKGIEYGSWYMNELLTKFNGQEPLAIIAYNCGPHRVDKWLAARGEGTETDEFIEEVPYRQSRRYVKSVLRYISLYRRTYRDRSDLYVGQRLDPEFQTNINW